MPVHIGRASDGYSCHRAWIFRAGSTFRLCCIALAPVRPTRRSRDCTDIACDTEFGGEQTCRNWSDTWNCQQTLTDRRMRPSPLRSSARPAICVLIPIPNGISGAMRAATKSRRRIIGVCVQSVVADKHGNLWVNRSGRAGAIARRARRAEARADRQLIWGMRESVI